MPCDRKRLLGYVETIHLIVGVTDKYDIYGKVFSQKLFLNYNHGTRLGL